MRNTNYLRAGLILIFSILSINVYAQNPSKREIKKFKLPDGSTLICLVPPPDVMTKTDMRSVEATIPKIVDIFKQGGQIGGKVDRQRSFERIRQEVSSLNVYEVFEYRLCLQAAGGVLTREEYKEAAEKLRPAIGSAHNQDIPNTPPEKTPSRKWQVVPIQSRDQDKTIVWDKNWKDIFWSGPEGWLCGAIDEGGGGGDVGRGILLHTKDGGYSWTEFDKNNFASGQGTFTWGPYGNRQYGWFEVGPIYSCSWYRRALGKGSSRTEAWLASATGIYFSDDGGMSWKRITPPPDDPKRYAFFFRYVNVEAGSEIYAVGWQGIAHWPGNGQRWELQMPTYSYEINSITLMGGSENRSVWAVGRAGLDAQGNGGDRSHGAIYHLTWPENRWEKVPLPGISFLPGQSLNDILLVNYETVFAVGQQGLILRGAKTDGKWNWTSLAVPTKEDLNSLGYADGTLWAVGNAGVILESRDDGKTWVSTLVKDERGKAPNLQRIHFFNDTGWVAGDGVVLRIMQP